MKNLKYYFLTWNMNKSFQIILSDGDYMRFKSDDRYEYEGKVYGTIGGWTNTSNKFLEPKMYEKPQYDMMFDPNREDPHTKSEIVKKTIRFIFEKFRTD